MIWIYPEEAKDDIYSTLLHSRKITDHEKFFNPKSEHLHDPFLMYGVKEAAEAILKAIKDNKKIFIHGDFDVDGITATTIMWRYLYYDLGANVMPYIPSRFDEGYGLSDDSIQNIIDEGGQLLITVDCGVKDIEIVHKYKDKIDFVITDHHTVLSAPEATEKIEHGADKTSTKLEIPNSKQVGENLISSDALAVVHPRLGGSYPFGEVCGALVSWKVCCGINELSDKKTDMLKYLDLVSLGTVCDVMPLIDENRVIVSLGLEVARKNENKGLQALLDISSVSPTELKAYHYGYIIGPRLNASGRISHALEAVRLLSTNSTAKALEIAEQLNKLNLERQELTKKYIDIAMAQIAEQGDKLVYVVHGEEWPEGVLGLIAGKLTQSLYRPVLAASKIDAETIKGSARSIEDLNIAKVLKNLDKYLVKHGGHAGAAGFTLLYSNLENFIQGLNEEVTKELTGISLEPKLYIDAKATLEQLDFDLIDKLNKFEPFGHNNESPIIAIDNLKITNQAFLGKDRTHLKLLLTDDNNNSIEAIGFNFVDTFNQIKDNLNERVSIAGYLDVNEWNGRSKLQFKIKDLK